MAKRILATVLVLAMTLFGGAALADKQSAGELAAQRTAELAEGERVVNVFTWTYYIPDEVVDAFIEATGMTVNYTPFSSNEEMLAKLQSVTGQYDLLVCSDYMVEILASEGMAAELDREKLTNWSNINPAFQGKYYDAENRFSIPYTNTFPLIVYDPEAVTLEPKSYADLWDASFAGGLVVIDDMRNIIGMAEKKLGLSFNETDPEKLAQVKDELMGLKDNIVVFNADTPHTSLMGGDAVAGYMFGSQIVAALEEMPSLKVAYPEEGLSFGIDSLVMPADAPHTDATYIFLDYLLDGEVSACASELINYGNCNLAAQDFLSEEFLADECVNAPEDAVADSEIMRSLPSEALEIYNDIWTEFRK